jgi:hypothetical protein
VIFRLVFDEANWPLLTGGRCSEVVVKAGMTVIRKDLRLLKSLCHLKKMALSAKAFARKI